MLGASQTRGKTDAFGGGARPVKTQRGLYGVFDFSLLVSVQNVIDKPSKMIKHNALVGVHTLPPSWCVCSQDSGSLCKAPRYGGGCLV